MCLRESCSLGSCRNGKEWMGQAVLLQNKVNPKTIYQSYKLVKNILTSLFALDGEWFSYQHHTEKSTPAEELLPNNFLHSRRRFGCTPNFWTVCLSTLLGPQIRMSEQMGSFASRSSAWDLRSDPVHRGHTCLYVFRLWALRKMTPWKVSCLSQSKYLLS